jgi:hypothetical protein
MEKAEKSASSRIIPRFGRPAFSPITHRDDRHYLDTGRLQVTGRIEVVEGSNPFLSANQQFNE